MPRGGVMLFSRRACVAALGGYWAPERHKTRDCTYSTQTLGMCFLSVPGHLPQQLHIPGAVRNLDG